MIKRIDAFELWCWRRLFVLFCFVLFYIIFKFYIIVLVLSPLDCKEIQPVHLKGNQSWIFIGRTDAEAETPILWPPDAKNWLIWKDPDAGQDWRQEEKGMTGWDGWMASLTQWTWVWVNSRSWQWTGRPGVLQSMGSQRVGHNWVTELNWTDKEEHTICGPKSLVFKVSQKGDLFILLSSSLDTHSIVQAHSLCKCWHLLSNWRVFPFSFSQVLKLPKALLSFKALLKSSLLNRHRPSHHFLS